MINKDKDQTIAALRAEINTLKTVIARLPGNVYWKNAEGKYLGCNTNFAIISKLNSPDEIYNKTDSDILDVELAEKISQTDISVVKNRKEIYKEEDGVDSNGNAAIYLSQKSPLFDLEGNVIGILGVSIDITDRKQMEENLKIAKQKAEAANRAKSRFLATISHELRIPLTSILGFGSLMEELNIKNKKEKEYIKHIIYSGSYLLSLINNLLDYNRLETDNFELINLPLNLKKLMADVISMLSGAAKLKNLSLQLDYPENIPYQVIGDSRVIQQILVNLVGNAIKFTEKGHVIARVKCLEDSAESTELQIAIEDTGIGIPKNEQTSVFKRFYQVGNVYTRNTSLTGTGLGLAIVKNLVKLMGGKISVTSKLNVGTTFYFTSQFKKTTLSDIPAFPYANSVKILIVQDDAQSHYVFTLLTHLNYDTTNSKDALNTLFTAQQKKQPYDIVIIDTDSTYIQPNKLIGLFQEQNNLHQPLVVVLSKKRLSKKKNTQLKYIEISAQLQTAPTFQQSLTVAWEKWQKGDKQPYVLLVEDDPIVQIVHTKMFESLGAIVDVVGAANEALAMLKNKYDILFVDLGLPDIDGFELIQTIREQRNPTPIVALTGYSEEEERQRCLQVGANEVAIKPIPKNELGKLVLRYTSKRITTD